MNNEIKNALEKDVDMTPEEYKAKFKKADAATAAHGFGKKAPVSEAVRHKRIQSNFYGYSLNMLNALLAEQTRTNTILMAIYEELKEGKK